MKLYVRVIEARNLRAMDFNGLSDPYVKLVLGRTKYKTKVVKKNLNPSWGEEFIFKVEDLKDELVVSVLDEDKIFNNEYVGVLKIPVCKVFDAENNCLGTSWYTLQPKNKKSKKDCGEILLTISFSQRNSFVDDTRFFDGETSEASMPFFNSPSRSSFINSPTRSDTGSPSRTEEANASKEERASSQKFPRRLTQIFHKNGETASGTHRGLVSSDFQEIPKFEVQENKLEDQSSSMTFEEAMKVMESKDQGEEIPCNLPSGTLLDNSYMISPSNLNSLLFAPDSSIQKSLAELQGTTEQQYGPWEFENGGEKLKRVLTYLKAATRLIKAVKGTEEQTYLKADGKVFAVLASVNIPDVPCGSTFRTEILTCITPGPEVPSGEQTSRLVISWRMNFLQSTMMKGMIEGGARQGLKESFEQFAELLSQAVRAVDLKDLGSNMDQVLASMQVEPQSDWQLATQYLLNVTVISTILAALYVIVHIFLALPSKIQGLEFDGVDLPDSIGELIVAGILAHQGKRVWKLIVRFLQARRQKGSDHGVKAQGDGWLLTVALMEGTTLAAVGSDGFSDPYVVFTCNAKTRTSSIKFQKSDPQWNEVFEFDAMDEPPSMLDIEVFDFDGPFDEAVSLGHAEINFIKSNVSDLADVWIPLNGKLAQANHSKLHLRIFLNNTKGSKVVREYLAKMEKEVGKKLSVRSPQTNSTFQKIFRLPPEEFLINDFTCHLKRKMPLQGRLFLSPRIIGFHTNMFGHKTKFFFLWEDIDDIQVLPPTLASMGSPSIIIVLRQGRGMDAKHGAKAQDGEGRLKFHFQSFVSFNIANRTIMALWKARSLSPEQKVQLIEQESAGKCLQTEESGCFLGLEDANMSEVYSSVLPIPMSFFMDLFTGEYLENNIMERVGCVDYSHTPWEPVKPDLYQRQIFYKLDKSISRYKGEVTSTQQKSPLSDNKGWVVDEVMTLNGVPFGDYFTLHIKYQVEDRFSKACNVQVFLGIAWQKSTRHQKRITKNVLRSLSDRLKTMYIRIEKEFVGGK